MHIIRRKFLRRGQTTGKLCLPLYETIRLNRKPFRTVCFNTIVFFLFFAVFVSIKRNESIKQTLAVHRKFQRGWDILDIACYRYLDTCRPRIPHTGTMRGDHKNRDTLGSNRWRPKSSTPLNLCYCHAYRTFPFLRFCENRALTDRNAQQSFIPYWSAKSSARLAQLVQLNSTLDIVF